MFRRRRDQDALELLDITLNDVVSGIFVTGTTGSGKTSLLRIVLQAVLDREVGCVWCCAKASEAENAIQTIRSSLMQDRLVHLVPGQFTFNFPVYELSRVGGSPASLAKLFQHLNEMLNRTKQGEDESFWSNLFFNFLMHSITVAWLAKREKMTVETISEVISLCPATIEEINDKDYMKSPFGRLLTCAQKNLRNDGEARLFNNAVAFFFKNQSKLGSRARGAAITQCQNVLSPFLLSPIYETVCAEVSTFTPDMPLQQYCCVLDFPILVYQESGMLLQSLIVMMTQQAALRRAHPDTFCVIIRDELQLLCASPEWDMMVRSVARSHLLADIAAVQNIPLLKAAFGGDLAAEQRVMATLANYRTKFLLANICQDTNSLFSQMLGEQREQFVSLSENVHGEGEGLVASLFGPSRFQFSTSEQMYARVPSDRFLSLRRGGPECDYLIDAIMTMGGKTFDGLPYKLVTFSQR